MNLIILIASWVESVAVNFLSLIILCCECEGTVKGQTVRNIEYFPLSTGSSVHIGL